MLCRGSYWIHVWCLSVSPLHLWVALNFINISWPEWTIVTCPTECNSRRPLSMFCFHFVTSIFTFYCSHVLVQCLYWHLLTKEFLLYSPFRQIFKTLLHIEMETRLELTTTIQLEVFKHFREKGFFHKRASPWREGCWVIQTYIFSSWVDVRIGGVRWLHKEK